MTDLDFETRVRDAIAHGTDGQAPTDLVERVHERVRARRRRTASLTAGLAAASVAVVAVATALNWVADQVEQANTDEDRARVVSHLRAKAENAMRRADAMIRATTVEATR